MADTAPKTIYTQEFIAGFEQRETLLRKTVTTEADVNGTSAVFLVADSGTDVASTRGQDGLIIATPDTLNQYTATMLPWYNRRTANDFNIVTGQGDRRRIMQMNAMAVLNRRIDNDILKELDTGTQDTNVLAATASVNMVLHAKTILGNEDVPMDGNLFAVISSAFEAKLMPNPEFSSADYVDSKPFTNSLTMFRWLGINFIVHPGIEGKGTAAEKCFLYHKNAVGHVFDKDGIDIDVGYNEEHKYSYASARAFMGSKLLQNGGVVRMLHDGSGFAAV